MNKIFPFFLGFIFINFLLFIQIHPSQALECTPGFTYKNQQELEEIKRLCEIKLNELQNTKKTLFSEISYMDTQIYLTHLKIQEIEEKIRQTENEIEILNNRINNLDNSLNFLTKILLKKIVVGYKKRVGSIFDFFLSGKSFNDFFNHYKYLKTAQENNQKLLIQTQKIKLNFEEQKKLREKKKVQLDDLNIKLSAQTTELNLRKNQKQKLLIDTQNSEIIYQKLLNQAQQQLLSFKSFVQTSGASTIISANSLGIGSDGNYYSQRDERWANTFIGYSSETVLNVGCLITSIAIVAKKYGQNLTPYDIASDVDRFWGNTAYMKLPWVGVAGRSYVSINTDNLSITNELNNGNYVIVGVGGCGYGGSHFVVLIKKDGDDYIMHDPIYGPDIKFSSHYGNICSAATFK
ncbi:MAG: hypothetical protein N2482_01250 [Patescibacteria group bacterium]|nr:hypothetical protein [Patescibacteria group bacterium]